MGNGTVGWDCELGLRNGTVSGEWDCELGLRNGTVDGTVNWD